MAKLQVCIRQLATVLPLTLLWAPPAAAATYIVLPDGSGDFPNIAAALSVSISGDLIELGDGVFNGPGNEDLTTAGQVITLRSRSGNPAACVIDPEGHAGEPHRAMIFAAGEGASTIIEGIGFRGGDPGGTEGGGAVLCVGSAPSFVNCRFTGNQAWRGGGLLCDAASPTLSGCVFQGNLAGNGGGALAAVNGAAPVLSECEFAENSADFGGAVLALDASPRFDGCRFRSNSAFGRGGALYAGDWAMLDLTGCTLAWNGAPSGGGLALVTDSEAVLTACIIAFATEGGAVGIPWPGPTATLECCDLFGNAGGDWSGDLAGQLGQAGNIGADPLFCGDAADGDLGLSANSPCAAAQSDCGQMGALAVGCGSRGVIGGASWSALKQYY